MRFFIAIPIPGDIKKQLTGLQSPVKGVRWVPEEQLHLTLKFAGDLGETSVLQLRQALGEIQFDSFEIAVESMGFFLKKGIPRVFWAGVTHQTDLFDLQRNVDEVAVKAGADKNHYSYKPHITLARIKNRSVNKDQLKPPAVEVQSRNFIVDRFILFKSLLRPAGAVHKEVAVYRNISGFKDGSPE